MRAAALALLVPALFAPDTTPPTVPAELEVRALTCDRSA